MTKQDGNKIGYARVSTVSQNLDSQIDMLKKNGCTKIFTDKSTGTTADRPGWKKLLEYIREDDTIVVTELSRMTRSLMHLLQISENLAVQNINLVSIRENLDTTSATGRCFFSIIGAISQLEKELRAERAVAGRASAKARGRSGGRPRTDPDKLEQARILYENSNKTAAEVCEAVGVGRRTFYNYLAQTKSKNTKE
jgi:DNA invertase Pin-like site-specific DNA recombinase